MMELICKTFYRENNDAMNEWMNEQASKGYAFKHATGGDQFVIIFMVLTK